MIPLFAELCAGTAALSLRLHGGKHARPPVSRMGNKQGYAAAILRCLGLRSGSGAARYLWFEPDDGCRLLLTSYRSAEIRRKAAEIIRGWKDEDPRALWERLRAEGPVKSPRVDPREVARYCFLHVGSFSEKGPHAGIGRPEGKQGGDGFGAKRPALEQVNTSILSTPTLPATIAPDARAVDPREVARWIRLVTSNRLINLGPDWKNTGAGGSTFGGAEFCTAIPVLLHALGSVVDHPATILPDARAVCPPDDLPAGSVVYMDPPYLGHLGQEPTTGYGHALPRADVVAMARRWADAGAWVVISECAPLVELEGWHVVEITGERIGQKRTFSKQKREFLTMSKPPHWRPSVQRDLWANATAEEHTT